MTGRSSLSPPSSSSLEQGRWRGGGAGEDEEKERRGEAGKEAEKTSSGDAISPSANMCRLLSGGRQAKGGWLEDEDDEEEVCAH